MPAPLLEHNQRLAPSEAKQLERPLQFYLFGTNRSRLEQIAKEKQRDLRIATNLKQADLFLTTRSYYRRKPQKIRDAEALGIPIYALKSNNATQMRQCLDTVYPIIEMQPAYVHHLQHLLAKHHGFAPNNQRTKPADKRK